MLVAKEMTRKLWRDDDYLGLGNDAIERAKKEHRRDDEGKRLKYIRKAVVGAVWA